MCIIVITFVCVNYLCCVLNPISHTINIPYYNYTLKLFLIHSTFLFYNRDVIIDDGHLIQIASACKMLVTVALLNNSSFTDYGISRGLFANCHRLETLELVGCSEVAGKCLVRLPISLRNVCIESIAVSYRFKN